MYTNTNYILLGMLIAQLHGSNYADALHNLFGKFDCGGATVASPSWARQANENDLFAASIDLESAKREVIGDGDVCLTPNGALIWLEQLVDGGLLDSQHHSLMLTAGPIATGRPSGYGCGWFIEPMDGGTIAHHGGHFDGWTAMAYLAPSKGCGVVVMCNLAPGNTRAVRYLAQLALEGYAPGSTPLSLATIQDDAPDLTAMASAQLFRNGTALDQACFAEELLHVVAHGSAVRNVINLWTGVEPLAFELVEQHLHPTHRLRRYRVRYPDRVEHVLVGTTPAHKIYWAWPL